MTKLLRTIAMAIVLAAPQAYAGMIGPEDMDLIQVIDEPSLAERIDDE